MKNPFEGVDFDVLQVKDTVCIDSETHSKHGQIGIVESIEGSTVWVKFLDGGLFPFHALEAEPYLNR